MSLLDDLHLHAAAYRAASFDPVFGPSHRSGVAASLMGVLVNRGEQLNSSEFLTPTEAGLQSNFNLQLGDPELSSLLEAVRSLYVGAHTAEYLSAAHGELQTLQAYREIARHVVAGEEHAALGLLYSHSVLLMPARPDLAAAMRETVAELAQRSSALPKVCREAASFLRVAALVADSSSDNPIDVSEVAQCLGSMDPSSHQAVIRACNTAFDDALSLTEEVTIDELEIRTALASPDAGMRRVAYYKARKSPAFRSVDESWGDAFFAYREFLQELYETGMADPDPGVRAAAVIFGRRIIYGLSSRNQTDRARAWSARIVRDTQDATEPALIRARLLAQKELAVELPDEEHRLREMRKLLENMGPAEIDSDEHACVRADLLMGLASSAEGDELWPLAFASVEAAVLAYPRDEYQQYDFHSQVGTWGLWTATKRYEAGDVESWLHVLDQIAPFMNYFSSAQQERYQLLLWQLMNAPDEYPQRALEIAQIQRRIFLQTELTHPNELRLLQARRALSLANERVSAADPSAPTQSTQAATALLTHSRVPATSLVKMPGRSPPRVWIGCTGFVRGAVCLMTKLPPRSPMCGDSRRWGQRQGRRWALEFARMPAPASFLVRNHRWRKHCMTPCMRMRFDRTTPKKPPNSHRWLRASGQSDSACSDFAHRPPVS